MLPALRQPLRATKQIASLQYVSSNRLLLGVGVVGGEHARQVAGLRRPGAGGVLSNPARAFHHLLSLNDCFTRQMLSG
jgi:alkanesulfonate monooxygenase SsuD/methylene tetrahydromethanopterin reductase-like flavin-dependent oxidoreductase (luciferase family)